MAILDNLPRERAMMSPQQVEAVLAFFVGLKLTELHNRQNLVRAKQHAALALPDSPETRVVFSNLAVDDELLAEAVYRKASPPKRHTIDVMRWA